jgi:hypothetical protein
MELIEFIKEFKDKPLNHKNIWLNILCELQSDTNQIELYKFIKIMKVSKASFYRIFYLYNKEILINRTTYTFVIKNFIILINEKVTIKSSPSIVNKGGSKEVVYSESVIECYKKCLLYFPVQLQPIGEVVKTWLETIEKLNRIDKIPFDLIALIVMKARNDDFWSKNFLSITKLRKKNGDGIMYIIVFNEKFNKSNNSSNNKIEKAHESINKAKQFNWEADN